MIYLEEEEADRQRCDKAARCDAAEAEFSRLRGLLQECRNLRQPTPGNWPGEPVLPGWMICRIDDALKAIPAQRQASNPEPSAGGEAAPLHAVVGRISENMKQNPDGSYSEAKSL